MLQIRAQQFESFESVAHSQFEELMLAHLKEFAPTHAEGVGEEGLRRLIRLGLQRASTYGFTVRGAVRFYIEMMVMFGSDFDTDPLLHWANRGLRRPGPSQLARADALHVATMQYRERVIGPKFEVEAAAIKRLVQVPVKDWLAGDHSDAGIETRMRAVYPEKCNEAEPSAVRTVIARGRKSAERERLPTHTGGTVFSALMLAFGHGCVTDPQFPWIAKNLKETQDQPGDQRVEKLATRAIAYLSAGLAELEQG